MSRNVSLAQANAICSAALLKARELNLKPITVAVLDPGGSMVAMQREDGSSNLRSEIARGKAHGALALGVSSRTIAEMAIERPTFIASLGSLTRHGVIPAAGGLIVLSEEQDIIGAVGVTGDTSDNDEECAVAAIGSVGLIAQR